MMAQLLKIRYPNSRTHLTGAGIIEYLDVSTSTEFLMHSFMTLRNGLDCFLPFVYFGAIFE